MKSHLYDSYQRRINYLRLSVTDRCNFRCQYCMPEAGSINQMHQDILSYEDLLMVAEAAVSLGVEKIRITGGEPLLREGIIDFLRQVKSLPGLNYLALTTNGYTLVEKATQLYDLGVTSLNVSLDSLDPVNFNAITRTGYFKKVLDGVLLAYQLGIPIKINVVVMKGINDHEILDFVDLAKRYNINVRFIEFMPSSVCASLEGISAEEIYRQIATHYQIEKQNNDNHSGPSQDYRIIGGKGRIGIISAMSCPFCSSCNRIRVTSTGGMKNCLFSDDEIDLKPYLQVRDLNGLSQAMLRNVLMKPEKHDVHWGDAENPSLRMASVGG
jgi:GTP 3',8-cyclase